MYSHLVYFALKEFEKNNVSSSLTEVMLVAISF